MRCAPTVLTWLKLVRTLGADLRVSICLPALILTVR